jgi:hypothetical protein
MIVNQNSPEVKKILLEYHSHSVSGGKVSASLSNKSSQLLIGCQVRQIKVLDIPQKEVYPYFNSHTIQSSGKLSA